MKQLASSDIKTGFSTDFNSVLQFSQGGFTSKSKAPFCVIQTSGIISVSTSIGSRHG